MSHGGVTFYIFVARKRLRFIAAFALYDLGVNRKEIVCLDYVFVNQRRMGELD